MVEVFQIVNIDNETILSTENEAEFVHFVNKIAKENEDYDLDLRARTLAVDYINEYCDNLTLTITEKL